MIESDINEQMARFAPSQNPADPGFDAIEKAVAGMSGVPMPKPEPVDMDIDRAVQDIAAQRRQDMASSLMAASEVNPDEAAQADALGRRFGVGQDIALRNMSEMRRQAMIQDTERMDLLRKDPVLARYIADREFAAQASDDVGVLSMLRPMVIEAATLQTPGGFFRVVGRGYERGQIVSELGDIGAKTFFGFAEQGDFDRAKQLQDRMQQLGQQGLLGSTAEMIAQNAGQLRTIGTTAAGGAAIGSFFGPPGLVIGGGLGAAAGIVIGTGTMEAGNLYLDMRDKGVSDDAAIPAAIAGGFLNGVIEVVGMKIASAPFKALASKVIREEVSKAIAQPTMRSALIAAGKAYGLQVGGEAAEEGLQEIVAIASEEIAKAADGIDSETSLREATGRVIEAFAYGGMASALLGGIGSGANLVVDLRRASATQRQQAFFNGLAENRKESKLAQRNPQGYERFLAAQAKDTPAETIYVDAATARDILAQSGTTTAQLEDILPGIRERLEKAVETGGDVTIPTSQFGARLANTELGNALLPHMRLSPEAMSATEAQAFEAQRQAVVEEARTILATKQEADAAFVAEAQQVEDEAFEQVRSVGQFTDIEARTIAKLRQAMVVVDAAEAGMTPAQYQRERGVPLVIQGEGMVAPTGPLEQADQFDQAGQRRTDTPQFRDYFGESKVVDEQGQPRVVYHGTNKLFDIFKVDPLAWFGDAFLASQFVAGGRMRYTDKARKGSMVYPVYLSIQRPLMLRRGDRGLSMAPTDMVSLAEVLKIAGLPNDEAALRAIAQRQLDTKEAGVSKEIADPAGYLAAKYLEDARLYNILDNKSLIETFKNAGYDGIGISEDGSDTWAVFSPEQVKSVNNRGTWDKTSPRMMEQAATLDADYLAAVERGDTATAQRMVDEAAQVQGQEAIVRDEAGNIVPLSRRFDITSPKLFEQAAAGPRLMAVHNLSADNLAFAERMGGLAVPSIGVVTEQAGGVESFGEITLIGSREMADPSTSRVFEADAYSARFPRPEWPKVPVAKADAVVKQIREAAKQYDDTRIVDNTFDGMVNQPDAERVADQWLRSLAIQALFLRAKGIDVPPVMREAKSLTTLSWDAIDRLRPLYKAVNWQQSWDEVEASAEFAALQTAYANEVRQTYAAVAEEFPEGQLDRMMRFDMRAYQRMLRDLQTTERQVVAFGETQEALDNALQPYKAEFKTWVDGKVRSQFDAPFLRVGKLKKPYTLGNIVDVMTSAKVKGEEKAMTFGAGAARAAASKEFVDLEQMREAASKAIVDPDEYGAESKKSSDLLEAYRNAMVEYTTLTDWRGKSDTWAALDGSMRAIAKYGKRKRKSEKAMRDALRREGFDVSKMSPELIDQAIEAADALYTAPVPYFESKPQRAVKLGEFKGAVIPSNASAETRSILERNNIPFVEYGSEQTRVADVRKFADLLERGSNGVFFQAMPSPGPARGGFDPRTLNILIGEGGDVSTLAHELIHLRVAEYLRMARSATPPARVIQDLDTLFVFMGVEGSTFQERLDNYERMTIEQRRPLEEKATYNFEIYLYEGKAPSVELRGVFDRLAAWMRRVYKSIRDDLNAIYRREFGTDLPILTSEVRAVFDRMLASEEQIRRQEAINGMKGLFQTREEAFASGMDDAQWAAFQAMQQEATDAAVTDLNTASMRQVQWLGNARARILRDLQKKHDAKRKEVTAEVAAAVKVEPVYRAMTYLRYGRFVDTDGAEVEVEGTHRLDIEKVRAMYAGLPSAEGVELIRATGMAVPANVRPDITPLGTGKYGMLGRDGLDPDVVAEMFGYSSGDEMVRALLAAKPMKDAVAERTDAEMLRRYGDMNTPAALEAEVQKALHNEARARMVAVQLRFVSKAQTPVRVMLEAAKQVAADMISDTTIRNLRPNDFVAAEARAARDSEYLVKYEAQPRIRGRAEYDRVRLAALAAGSTEEDASIAATAAQEAFIAAQTEARSQEFRERFGPTTPQEALIRAQRAQLYQNQLAAEALRVKEYVDKQVKYLRRVLRDENVKRMGADAADQVRAILDNYSLVSITRAQREQVADLRNWIANAEADGTLLDIDPALADSARRRNYTELTVAQFRDLVDSVKLIEYRGKNERNIYLAGQKLIFEEMRDGVVASMTEVAEKKGRKVRKELGDEDRKWMNNIASYDASQQTIGNIIYVLDGGKRDGPLAMALLMPANDAGNQEARDRAVISEKVNDIVGPLAKKGQFAAPKMYFRHIDESLSLEQRMVIALNYGNQSNIDRLLTGEQWTADQASVIIESLTEEQLNAVQAIWDVMSSFRDRVAEKSRRLTGKEPRWLEPLPMSVTSADGKIVQLRGGYYPAKYNPRRSVGARESDVAADAERLQREAYTATTTSRSFEKNRSDRPPVGQVLSRQFVGMYAGLNEVIHDLAWHDFAISANRLLRDREFQRVIKERYGLETYNSIKDWVDVVVAGDRTKYDSFEKLAIFARQNVSVAAMGLKTMTAAVQPTGIFPAMTRVGIGPMVRAVTDFAYSPVDTSRNVLSRSLFMQERGRTRFRDLNEIANIVRDQSRIQRIRRGYISSAYVLASFSQGLVDTSVWMAAYSNAIKAGKSEKVAVFIAEQTVIDTQGSGRIQDLSSAMRGGKKQSAYAKLFTPFYQYSNTMYSLFGAQMRTAPSYGKAAKDAFLILTVGAIVEELIRNALMPSPEDEEPEDLIRKLAENQIDFVVGLPLGIREFRGAGSLIVGTKDGVQAYRGPSGLRIVTDATQAVVQARQGEFDAAFRRSMINLFGTTVGIPSAQINATIDGIEAVSEGEVEGPSAVLAPLTGVQR
jgi:hypothetical protein